MKRELIFIVLTLFLISFVVAENMTSQQNQVQVTDDSVDSTAITEDETGSDSETKICCHIYGLGAYMKKVNSRYQWMQESECVVPEGFVGGGREIVNDEDCKNKNILERKVLTQTQIKNIIKARNKIRIHNMTPEECPYNCTCVGSVTKCDLESGGREMIVRAGKSGNTIVQVKNINMSTKVALYKVNNSLYGVFRNNQTREVKILPDQVKDKIRERIKARLQNETIELDEDGVYQIRANKKARLFFIIPVKEKMEMQIDSETGEVIRTRHAWWGFLARDVRE